MYQGFYNLASGMLTQSRNLNVISNNMVNVQTSGYKRDKMVTSTFQEEMLYRTGTKQKGNPVPLAVTSKIKTASETHVDYEQGSYERTDGLYDFAIGGSGFSAWKPGLENAIREMVPLPWMKKDIWYQAIMPECFLWKAALSGFPMRTLRWIPEEELQPAQRKTVRTEGSFWEL